MNTEGTDAPAGAARDSASPTAGFFRASITRSARCTQQFASYRLDLAAQTLYDFAWHELCDWYLELTKAVLTDSKRIPRCAAARKRRSSTRSARC